MVSLRARLIRGVDESVQPPATGKDDDRSGSNENVDERNQVAITASERADERDECPQEAQTSKSNERLDNLLSLGRCNCLLGLFGRVSRTSKGRRGLERSDVR